MTRKLKIQIKFSALWACLGILVGAITVAIAWNFGPFDLYPIIMMPGNFVTSFFSHEIEFKYKLPLLLTGQYLFCFILILLYRLTIFDKK